LPQSLNWPTASVEAVQYLQMLLRLDTTNPPGNESVAAETIADILRGENIEPLLLASAPTRGNVIARLRGSGEKPPLLLYGHTDVVPAEPQYWTHPPFSGNIAEGFVWGRGALDMKGTVAQQLTVFLLLKRHGVPLRRDVIFAATADEEIGGEDSFGLAWLVKHHPDLLRAEFGITEVGGYNMSVGGKSVYPIQVAEKGTCWMKVRAKGRPGHASMPHDDNSVIHLSRAVARLASEGLPYHLCDAAAGFLESASAGIGGPFGEALSRLKSPQSARQVLDVTLKDHELKPFLNAMLHNTATVTGLAAGYKTNVIPSAAEATVDFRTLPGFTTESFVAEVRAVLGEAIEIEVTMESPPLETSHDTALFRLMVEKLQAHDPGAVAAPYMMTGATDAKYLARIGVPSYGFAPLKLPPGFRYTELFHAHNERAPVDGLGWGTRVLYDVVSDYCA